MAKYHHRSRTYSTARSKKRMMFAAGGVGLVILVILGWVVYDIARDSGSTTIQTTQEKVSVQEDFQEIFRTPYFQFQADESWVEIAGEFTENKYVYRSMNNHLVEHDLTVYVNAMPSKLEATRVQPVFINDESILSPNGPISEHCSTLLPQGAPKVVTPVKQAGIAYQCHSASALFIVLVSEPDAEIGLRLKRADDSFARYLLVYRDLTVSPNGNKLRDIVSSFRAL